MAIVEAASVGLLVVSTRVGGVPEVRAASHLPCRRDAVYASHTYTHTARSLLDSGLRLALAC